MDEVPDVGVDMDVGAGVGVDVDTDMDTDTEEGMLPAEDVAGVGWLLLRCSGDMHMASTGGWAKEWG